MQYRFEGEVESWTIFDLLLRAFELHYVLFYSDQAEIIYKETSYKERFREDTFILYSSRNFKCFLCQLLSLKYYRIFI